MKNVRTRVTNIASHLLENSNVVVAVEQHVFLAAAGAANADFVRLKTCLRKHHDQTLGVFVVGVDGGGLLGHEGGEGREGLGAGTFARGGVGAVGRGGGHCC